MPNQVDRKQEQELQMLTALRSSPMMHEAIKLASDGEIGNSDAIALLQMPHSSEEVREVLTAFDKQLTREARAKLTLDAFVPRPAHVQNQRYEPIFDKYPISGKTYTTASGIVVLNEVQYYNGEMVQIFGDCVNVSRVREALAWSGYQPLGLRYRDGRETVIAQFWSHNLTDTSLRPYNAMFIVVAAVREGAPDCDAFIKADDNGASSVLSALRGSFNPTTAVYENDARLFFVRLLDSTKVAIEVGRERMGTDKRPGTIDLTHTGRQIAFSVKDGAGHKVADINVTLTEDPHAYLADVAAAAATAGMPFNPFPSGTEFVYPSVARIGNAPVVDWQWRTDLQPRLQSVKPNTVVFDSSSDEGAIMNTWGFRPQVLGYLANVRGVVTGVPEPSPNRQRVRIVGPTTAVRLLRK